MSSHADAANGPTEPATAKAPEAEHPGGPPSHPEPQVNGNKDEKQPKGSSADAEQQDGNPARAKTTKVKEKLTGAKQKMKDNKENPPGGFDDTPLPDAPPGYTVKFVFHKAVNLPVADVSTQSSDPYLHATLSPNVPKRHKDDPLLTFRTKTLRKNKEPAWEAEWVVANVPKAGFTLKCRLYDEDYPDHDDRLGNVTIKISHIDENWKGYGPGGKEFEVRKRAGSKRAYLLKAATSALSKKTSMTPRLFVSIDVLGESNPPYAQVYTVGPTIFIKHFSPMIGRLTGVKVNRDEEHDHSAPKEGKDKNTQKYDFQANEMQLAGPVPPKLYHRYVEFRPLIGMLFSSHGLRGRILHKALRHQHRRIYNYDSSTEYEHFEPKSEEASLQFLKLAHFDEGGRIFTYVLTLDGRLRFTETGKEFGIDLLSKHTMHSDVAHYIACSGEFFIRRLAKPDSNEDPEPNESTHPEKPMEGGPPHEPPPQDPRHYQLVIDNDSGTYRPDKSILPDLKGFLKRQFPGLGVVTMDCGDEELKKLKANQAKIKKTEGKGVKMVLNRNPSDSSVSSDDESRLGDLDEAGEEPVQSKKEMAYNVIENPGTLKEMKSTMASRYGSKHGGDKNQGKPEAEASGTH